MYSFNLTKGFICAILTIMAFITEMTEKDFVCELEQTLMPAFKARYDLVRRYDKDFYNDDVGKIDLLSMALISNRIRKHKANVMNLQDVDEAYTHEQSGDAFYKEGPHLMSHAYLANFPCDYDDINARLMKVFDYFAKDLGLDPIYAHFDKPTFVQPPFTANGIIRNFDDMKHSVLINAEIPAYGYKNEQKIPQEYIDRFCDYEQDRFLRKMEERNMKRAERNPDWSNPRKFEGNLLNGYYHKKNLIDR